MKDALDDFAGFQWDEGNKDKNLVKQQVENWESEQIFFNEPLLILDDPKHSTAEKRWAAFGRTEADRRLVVIFTKRGRLLRVISSREMIERELSMKRTAEPIPGFGTEDEERDFWAAHSPLDYFDSRQFKRALFPNLKPSLKSISIRLPENMLAELKKLANKKDVPYQSLAKIYLARQIALERGAISPAPKRKKGSKR